MKIRCISRSTERQIPVRTTKQAPHHRMHSSGEEPLSIQYPFISIIIHAGLKLYGAFIVW